MSFSFLGGWVSHQSTRTGLLGMTVPTTHLTAGKVQACLPATCLVGSPALKENLDTTCPDSMKANSIPPFLFPNSLHFFPSHRINWVLEPAQMPILLPFSLTPHPGVASALHIYSMKTTESPVFPPSLPEKSLPALSSLLWDNVFQVLLSLLSLAFYLPTNTFQP